MGKDKKNKDVKGEAYVNIANNMLQAVKNIEEALNDAQRYNDIKDGVSIPVGSIGDDKENGFILCVGIIPAKQMEKELNQENKIQVVERPKLIVVKR